MPDHYKDIADEQSANRVFDNMSSALSLRFTIAEIALSFIGAGIAGTLWWADRSKVDLPCTASGGCEIVAQSAWSHVSIGEWHAIPVALMGFAAYIVLLTLSMAKWGSESVRSQKVLLALIWLGSAGGFAYSWFLQYVAHFRIGAFCVWCFSSALTMTALLVVASWEEFALRRLAVRSSLVKEHSNPHG